MQSVPALPAGIAELFQLSKDAVLEKFGKPGHIFCGGQNLHAGEPPEAYFLVYEDLSFRLREGAVVGITLLSPNYVFGNGIHVGDSEAKVKQAFGPDSVPREGDGIQGLPDL